MSELSYPKSDGIGPRQAEYSHEVDHNDFERSSFASMQAFSSHERVVLGVGWSWQVESGE